LSGLLLMIGWLVVWLVTSVDSVDYNASFHWGSIQAIQILWKEDAEEKIKQAMFACTGRSSMNEHINLVNLKLCDLILL